MKHYHSNLCAQKQILLKYSQITVELHILYLHLQQIVSNTIFTGKLSFYRRVSKLLASLTRQTADGIRIAILKPFGINKLNALLTV
jgi:hypothetical protein